VCGLLDSDEQWDRFLIEAELWERGSQLRQLFVCNLLHSRRADALQLWVIRPCKFVGQLSLPVTNNISNRSSGEEEVQLHLIFFDVRWIRSLSLFLIRDVLCRTIPLLHDNHHHAKDACTVQSYWTWKTFLINSVLANVRTPITTATAMLSRPSPENDEMSYVDEVRYVGPCEAACRLSQFEMQGGRPAICRLQVCLFQSMVE